MTARQPPELDTDGDLDWCRGEILLLLACLKLNQDLMQLKTAIQTLAIPHITASLTATDKATPFPWTPFPWTPSSAAAPEQSSEMGRSGKKDSSGTATSDRLEQQQRQGQTRGEGWGVASGN